MAKNIQKATSVRGLEEEYTPHTTWAGNAKQLFSAEGGDVNIDTLYETVKHSPEVVACISAIVEDIMADGWRFDGSKSAVNSSKDFEIQAKYYKILTNAIIDLLITGDAYILKLSVDEEQIKTILATLTKEIAKNLNVDFSKNPIELVKQNLKKPKDLQLLKASTIRINFDETGKVSSYQQKVQGKERVYSAADVIHLSVMNIGGQPYGFTPLEPLLSDIATLIFAKEYAGTYFENDGVPYFLFNLPEATPDDRQYELLKKELKELKKSKNKYRTMVTTGQINTELINKFNKDMEFAKLIQHFTQIVFVSFGVPAHRLGFSIADAKSSASELGKIESGYFKKIAFMQKACEAILNKELWALFRVKKKFNKSYKIDEMREAQIAQIAAQVGFMTIEEIRERIGLDPEIPKGTMGNKTGDENSINFGRDREDEKGKERPLDQQTDNRLKVMKSINEAIEISFENLVKVVELKLGEGSFDQANILYLETPREFVLFFHDGNWKYKSIVKKETLSDVDAFRLEKLKNAIHMFI